MFWLLRLMVLGKDDFMTTRAEKPSPTPDPDYAARIQESFELQAFMGHVGAELTDLGPGTCEIQIPYQDALTQHHGFFHGGVIGTLADVSGGYAAATAGQPGSTVLTVEYKLNIIAPGVGEKLIGRGKVVRAGKTLVTTSIEVFAVKEGVETLCATALQTIMLRQDRAFQPAASA